ncbi:MAG: hypothetical protein M0D55_05080 [Elusimicrobiota bacterium]|nr:MAG: hypothetical protein M0D55_05080 [Elusimicrobiota bacterium]
MEAAERALGRQVADAFAAELSRHAPGRELLAKFPPPAGPPDMYVLKLTQNPNDPNQPGALYDASGDRMVFNHWDIVRVLQMKLPPERMKAIEGRAADVGLLSALFKEDPSLLRVLVDALDVNYFHELKHAEQARRGRLEIEQMRGNLPFANPLSKEHEAYREECRYLVSKGGSALVDSPFAQRCLMMLKDPDAHRDWITNLYVSNYNGFGTVDDVASRQEVRREAARASGEGWAAWGRRKLREAGLARGDEALAAYRAAELEREKAFLAAVPDLRRRGAEAVVAAHLSAGRYGEAFAAAKSLPHGTAEDHDKRLAGLADKAAAWIARDKAPGGRDARLNAAGAVGTYFNETGRPWPPR